MKAIYFVMCLCYLSVDAVINQPSQEAQRREAPIGDGPPAPHNEYGAPVQKYGPPRIEAPRQINQQAAALQNQRTQRLQAMQRLVNAFRTQQNGGYNSQGRVVNRPRPQPIPISQPQTNYGPPKNNYGPPTSSSGSLASFMHNHSPDVRCDGWIPIPGPSVGTQQISSGGSSASSGANINNAYGPPPQIITQENIYSQSSGHSASNVHAIDNNYGPPPDPRAPQSNYGVPDIRHGSSGNLNTAIVVPENSYGPPPSGPLSFNHNEIHSQSSGHASSSSIAVSDNSYGPPQIPGNTYGPPRPSFNQNEIHSQSSGHASSSSIAVPDNSYGPPQIPGNTYGPPRPSFNQNEIHSQSSGHASTGANAIPQISFGPPQIPINTYGPPQQSFNHNEIHSQSSGHASTGANAIPQISFGPPQIPINTYGPPQQSFNHNEIHSQSSGHASSSSIALTDNSYGPPQVPDNSYGPPTSGNTFQSERHHHEAHGHDAGIQTLQGVRTELELPQINSGSQFDNAIGFVTSSLGVTAGQNEVVQSHAIHESHTAELTNNVGFASSGVSSGVSSGDSYSRPPLDSYAPGKYAPTFLNSGPRPGPKFPQQLPQQIPSKTYLSQRPTPVAPRPQYIPPIPQKTVRTQGPPPQFRPQINTHAQSIAQGYSSGQSQQSSHSIIPNRQQPKTPLPYRTPVPQGLFQSIGQHVQALDNGHRGPQPGGNYLPPPTYELPIPPMKLIVPNSQPAPAFLSQHQSHGSLSTSNSAVSFQNQELRNVHIIHDCRQGHNNAGGTPHQTYGVPGLPVGKPLETYGSPIVAPLASEHHSSGLSSNYEIPSIQLEIPNHNSIDFNSPSNSYGPPASGPASTLDVRGLEALESRNSAVISTEHHNVISAGQQTNIEGNLPGLSEGLSSTGLNFISAQESQSIQVPAQGQLGQYQLHIQSSNSDGNRIDGQNHQQILSDGLLQSILSAVEQQPSYTVPQTTHDQETDHSEVQIFLKSPEGQDVLSDKQDVSLDSDAEAKSS